MRPVVRSGLVWPGVVAILAGVAWIGEGPGLACLVLLGGWGAIILFHLWHVEKLEQWAHGPLEAPVPEGRGVWQAPFTALYRRMRVRAAMQRDLTETVSRFRRAAEAVPDGLVLLDAMHRVRWANRRAQGHLGLDLAHDTGRPLANLVRQPEFVRHLERDDHGDALVMPSQRETGVTLSVQLIPFGMEERLLISRDITQLEAVTRMRRDFIANVSHELKTPLTVIIGFLETLEELTVDERDRQRFMQLMQDQARNMKRLVDDLLTLSALESDAGDRPDAVFPLAPLLDQLVAEARALSAGQHTVLIEAGEPAEIRGNAEELASAFGNLVSNAVRYTPVGGMITLRWRVDDDGTGVFSVADTGLGIAPEHIPRLTERFYRVDRSRSRATGGTGLGLAIVKHVLARHDAELVVESEPGKGSVFSVLIPARRVLRSQQYLFPSGDAARRVADDVNALPR